MKFSVGEVYELVGGNRTTVVTEIRDDGRSDRLRLATVAKNGSSWAELDQEGR